MKLSEPIKATLKDAARKLTGPKKRAFMAQVALDYFEGSARQCETYLGWSRRAVETGLHEKRTGIRCVDNYAARGRKKTEEHLPQLSADIRELIDGDVQADPKLQTTFCYSRVSARAVREQLVQEKGYLDEQLPCRQTIGRLLNRLGYRLKKH